MEAIKYVEFKQWAKKILKPMMEKKYQMKMSFIPEGGVEFRKKVGNTVLGFGVMVDKEYGSIGFVESFVSDVNFYEVEKIAAYINVKTGSTSEDLIKQYMEIYTYSNLAKYPHPDWFTTERKKRFFGKEYSLEDFMADIDRKLEEEAIPFWKRWGSLEAYYELLDKYPECFQDTGWMKPFDTFEWALRKSVVMALMANPDYESVIDAQMKGYFVLNWVSEDGQDITPPQYRALDLLKVKLKEWKETGDIDVSDIEPF